MAKITEKQWLEMRTIYEMSLMSLREIAKEYKYDAGNICKRAKKEEWVKGKLQQASALKVNAIEGLLQSEEFLLQHSVVNQKQIIDKLIIDQTQLKQKAKNVQFELLDTLRAANETVKELLENSSEGRYIKSEGPKGVTYGTVADIIPQLASGINSTNAIIKEERPIVAIQQNIERAESQVVKSPAECYEDMLNADN